MKRLVCLLLVAVLLSFSACGKKGKEPAPSSSEPVSSQEPSSEEPEEPQSGLLEEGERVSDSYFDDAVFIGDAAVTKLKGYVQNQHGSGGTVLGGAQFLANGLLGSGNTLRALGAKDSIHPKYNDQEMFLEDAVQAMGAKKVYIMLGHNDIGIFGTEKSAKNMADLLEKIKAKNPEASIFIQSATPIMADKQKKVFNNENLKIYNELIGNICTENGYYYVDAASSLQLEDGSLNKDYCSDASKSGFHLSDKGCEAWLDYLYTHTA